MREVARMVEIYVRWIKAGRMALDDVPERWREKVKVMLSADGG